MNRVWSCAYLAAFVAMGLASSGCPKNSDDVSSEPKPEKKPKKKLPNCDAITGSYSASRTRSTTKPGSCEVGSAESKFNRDIPMTIGSDSEGKYDVQIGYSDPTSGVVTYAKCINNVVGCTINATCEPGAGTDQLQFTIDGESISGTIERTARATKCTINFDVTGRRK